MKKTVFLMLAALALFLGSCHVNDSNRANSGSMAPAPDTSKKTDASRDSILLILNSEINRDIKLPPLFTRPSTSFDPEAAGKFGALVSGNGREYDNAGECKMAEPGNCKGNRNPRRRQLSIMLLMDKTGSMEDDIANIRNGLNQIIDEIKSFKKIRLAIALYGDKNVDGPGWFTYHNFENHIDSASIMINDIQVTGGGDMPESVYEGFFAAAAKNFWKSKTKRMIILIGDAPPLEKPMSHYDIRDVINRARKDSVIMNFYPILISPLPPAATKPVLNKNDTMPLVETIFPNPTPGNITLNFKKEGAYTLEVFDDAGKMVLRDKIIAQQWHKDFSDLKNGLYLVRTIDKDENFEVKKFIVQK